MGNRSRIVRSCAVLLLTVFTMMQTLAAACVSEAQMHGNVGIGATSCAGTPATSGDCPEHDATCADYLSLVPADAKVAWQHIVPSAIMGRGGFARLDPVVRVVHAHFPRPDLHLRNVSIALLNLRQ